MDDPVTVQSPSSMKFLVKSTVNFEGVEPTVYLAIGAVAMAKALLFPTTNLVITSLKDGDHPGEGPTHGHHVGLAVDIRTNDMTKADSVKLFTTVNLLLAPHGYVVLLESGDDPNSTAPHMHIQFNPENFGKLWEGLQ